MERQNLVGRKFGKLTVIRELNERKNKGIVWECVCECGGKAKRTTGELKAGRRLTCGCMRTGSTGAWRKGKRERLYVTWCDMIQRCYDKNVPSYKYYGQKGVVVCEDWRNNYQAFKKWAYSHGYTDTLTIDRINNDGIYEPSNCRWVTCKEQNRNKSNLVWVTFMNKTMLMKDWAEFMGIKYTTLLARVKRGWDISKALTTHVRF